MSLFSSKRVNSGSDHWVGGLSGYAAVVVSVPRHHDVAVHTPASAPAGGGGGEEDGGREDEGRGRGREGEQGRREEGREEKGEKREGGRREEREEEELEIPTVFTCTYTVLHVIHVLMCTH